MRLASWLRHRTSTRTRRVHRRPATPRRWLQFVPLEERLCPSDVTFAPFIEFATGGSPVAVAVGDFNGDRRPDLAAANQFTAAGPSEPSTVSVLLGDGSGGFAPAVSFAAGIGSASVAVADFNGDGKPDLAVANAGTGFLGSGVSVSVLLADGSGGFAAPVNTAVVGAARSLAVRDFNG